eukprot:4577586-Prymnesium_polylepis.1
MAGRTRAECSAQSAGTAGGRARIPHDSALPTDRTGRAAHAFVLGRPSPTLQPPQLECVRGSVRLRGVRSWQRMAE